MSVKVGKQTVTFQSEALAHCWEEALPLMQDNYDETGFFLGEFKPDLTKLQRMEAAGFVRVFTARHLGKLIGYQVFFVMFGLNCPDALTATCHVAYVTPLHRGRTGLRFLRWVDHQLMIEGMTSITRQSTVQRDLSKLYGRMQYVKVEESWSRMSPFTGIMSGGIYDGY